MDSLISIIIPVYNREKYLEECIESVYNQSYQNFEIIMVDDGSTDSTLEIATNLAVNDSRIKLLKSKHQGVSAARNIALEAAQGEFVFFLDSDDIIHPLLLETFVKSLNNSDASIAATYALTINEKYWHKALERIANEKGDGETTYHCLEDALYITFTTGSPINNIGGVMIRRDLIGDTRFKTDLFIGEDFYFIYQNLIKGANTMFLSQKWYYARWHKQNTSKDYNFKGFWTRFYRRKLVWESEEAFGRTENAACQKRAAFACYIMCLRRNRSNSVEIKKMKKVIKEHKKLLLSAFGLKGKIAFYLALYAPKIYLFIDKIIHK